MMIQQIQQILTTQSGELLQALGQHLEISLLALLIAAVIGIPLAIILTAHQKLAEAMLQVTSVLRVINSAGGDWDGAGGDYVSLVRIDADFSKYIRGTQRD